MQFLLLSISNPVHTQPKVKALTQGQVQGRRLEWKRSPAVTLTVHTCVCLWEKSQHRSWNRSKILLICNASAEKLTGLRLCKPLASSEVGQLPPRSNEDFVFSKHTSGTEQAGLAFTSRAVWWLEIGRKPVFLYKQGTLAVKASYANPESHSVFFTVSFQSQIVCFTPLLTPQTQLLALKTWRNLRKIPRVTTAHRKTHTQKKIHDHLHLQGERGRNCPSLQARTSGMASPSASFFPCRARATFNNSCQSLPLKLREKKSRVKGSASRKETIKAPFKVRNVIPEQVKRVLHFISWAGGTWDTWWWDLGARQQKTPHLKQV